MKEFGDALRQKWKDMGMTQKEMAKFLRCYPSTLSTYVMNKKDPTLTTAVTIARKLGMSIGEMCGENCGRFTPPQLTYGNVADVIRWLLLIRKNGKPLITLKDGEITYSDALLEIALQKVDEPETLEILRNVEIK